MSSAKYPTLELVIPFFHLLFNRLNHFLEVRGNTEQPRTGILAVNGKPKEIVNAVVACRSKLMKYCDLLSHNIPLPHLICTGKRFIFTLFFMHKISDFLLFILVLNPAFKLEYFKHIGWSETSIRSVKSRIQDVWISSYKPNQERPAQQEINIDAEAEHESVSRVLWGLPSWNDENVTFEDDKDELDLYLEQGVTQNHKDTLGWWKVRSVDFPNVAKMARDFLAIPATSVAVERYFSSASHVTVANRGSLEAEKTGRVQEMKEFIDFGGQELINYLLSKMEPCFENDEK